MFGKDVRKGVQTPFPAQSIELCSFRHLVEFVNSRGEQWNQGVLWPERTRYALDLRNHLFSGWDLDHFENKVGPYLPRHHKDAGPVMTGRLGR